MSEQRADNPKGNYGKEEKNVKNRRMRFCAICQEKDLVLKRFFCNKSYKTYVLILNVQDFIDRQHFRGNKNVKIFYTMAKESDGNFD